MKETIMNSAFFGIALSLLGYWVGVWCNKKFRAPIFNPLLIGILLVILVLIVGKIDYNVYEIGGSYINFLLTPATICFALPLYRQIKLLKQHFLAIMAGVLSGVIASAVSILGLAVAFSLSHEEYVTFLPKSITTAIGMGASEELGGIVTITVAAIVLTGIIGNMMGEAVMKLFRIKNPIAKGVALGTSSHAMGTAKAFKMGEIEGAMSSLSLVITGLLTVITANIFAGFY